MKVPFTLEQFLGVFESYNLSVWPIQVFLNLLAIVAILGVVKKKSYSDKVISMILSFLWLWVGIVYHFIYFTSINKGAYLFGILFIIQGLLFLFTGVFKANLSFKYQSNAYGIIGSILLLYALIILPNSWIFIRSCLPKIANFWSSLPNYNFYFWGNYTAMRKKLTGVSPEGS